MCLHIIYMFTTWCMTYSTSTGSTRLVLHPLEFKNKSNQIKSNQIRSNQIEGVWNRGCQPYIIRDGTAPNLTIFTQNAFKFVHMIIKQKPLPPLYMTHFGISFIFHLAKCGVWVHEPCVLMTIPCMLIIYEAESNENLKIVLKIQNTARLSCKLATMKLMVWRIADRWKYNGGTQHDGAAVV
jgi:hypothetical protein